MFRILASSDDAFFLPSTDLTLTGAEPHAKG